MHPCEREMTKNGHTGDYKLGRGLYVNIPMSGPVQLDHDLIRKEGRKEGKKEGRIQNCVCMSLTEIGLRCTGRNFHLKKGVQSSAWPLQSGGVWSASMSAGTAKWPRAASDYMSPSGKRWVSGAEDWPRSMSNKVHWLILTDQGSQGGFNF